MSTEKRDRQRENRSTRIAAAEAEATRLAIRNRIVTYGVLAAAIVAAIVGFVVLTADDDSSPASTDTAADSSSEAAYGTAETEDGAAPDDAEADNSPDTVGLAPTGGFEYGAGDCPATDGSSGPVLDFTEPQPLCIDEASGYVAVFDTSEGEIRLDLRTTDVPGTVNNFVTLARWGYYDDTLLFRTDPSIDIVQGGAPHTNSPSDPGPGYTINDEPTFTADPTTGFPVGPHRYEPGQIVMARSAGFDSGSAQFFFTTGPNASLLDGQGTYVVFGTTDEPGLEIMQSIIALHESGGSLGGSPSRAVTVFSVTIEGT